MKILWASSTKSGLCDRLRDIVAMSAYAKCYNCDLYMDWAPPPEHENPIARSLDVPHRKIDILFENVKQHIIFPKNVNIVPGISLDYNYNFVFNEILGGGAVDYNEFWHSHLKDKCSCQEFWDNMDLSASEFDFNEDIKNFINSKLPDHFISFHIRRGDRVRYEDTPHYVSFSKLEELKKITYQCIDHYLEKFDYFYICGDEENKLVEFEEYIINKKRNLVRLNLDIPKWKKTYYEIAIMSRSEINIVSNKYSSFSYFPAMIGNNDFRSVYDYGINSIITRPEK